MDFISEIKAFDSSIDLNQLSTGQVALWYALFNINNRCAWVDWFTVPNTVLQAKTGLSRSGIYDSRQVLKEKGYIDFLFGSAGVAPQYTLFSLLKFKAPCQQGTLQDIVRPSEPLNKQDKTKQDKTKQVKQYTSPFPKQLKRMGEIAACRQHASDYDNLF